MNGREVKCGSISSMGEKARVSQIPLSRPASSCALTQRGRNSYVVQLATYLTLPFAGFNSLDR
jgi:hypothetical protein